MKELIPVGIAVIFFGMILVLVICSVLVLPISFVKALRTNLDWLAEDFL